VNRDVGRPSSATVTANDGRAPATGVPGSGDLGFRDLIGAARDF